MKPSTHDWGDIRSALHEPGLGVMERARRIERELPDGDSEAMRGYILDHLPNWAPKSPQVPYQLARSWMSGDLLKLLDALCRERTLVERIQSGSEDWAELGFTMEQRLAPQEWYLHFTPIVRSNIHSVWETLEGLGSLRYTVDRDIISMDHLTNEEFEEYTRQIVAGERNDTSPKFLIVHEDTESVTFTVEMEVLRDDTYGLWFDFEGEKPDEVLASMGFAPIWLCGELHRADPNFEARLHPYRLRPDLPEEDPDWPEIMAIFENMWQTYRSLRF